MITLHKLNGAEIVVNAELIESVEATPDTVRKAASEAENDGKRNEQLCEVNFYLGIYSLERKAPDDARKLMAAAADKCPDDVLEKLAAKAELARLTH